MTVPEALAIKEELEKIDELLKQLEEARETAQIGDHRHGGPGRIRRTGRHGEPRRECSKWSKTTCAKWPSARSGARRQRISADAASVSPLSRAICWRRSSATCRRRAAAGTRARLSAKARSKCSRPSRTSSATRSRNMDIPQTFINAMLRDGASLPMRMKSEDIEIHRTRNYAQVRHGRDHGHERLDALRRPIHQRQTDGAGAGRV